MPRPRKNDSTTVVAPLVDEFARRLGETLERFITTRIDKETSDAIRRGRPARGQSSGGARRKRATVLCYFPGCKNVAAPRFGMFCAALHKDLSRAEKDKYRSAHEAKQRVRA